MQEFAIAALAIILHVVNYNATAQIEHATRIFTKAIGKNAVYYYAVYLVASALVRDHFIQQAVILDQGSFVFAAKPVMQALGWTSGAIGILMNLWTLKALGIKGMYNGDSFGFLMDAPVTDGPYKYMQEPQYNGTTIVLIVTPTQLLAWATENRTEEPERPARHPEPIDPKWIEIILGKPDAARMKDCVDVVKSDATLDAKLVALDELEMLVESIDNANDLQPLKLWPELLNILLTSEESEIRVNVAWVMGTAVQNNDRAQQDFARAGGLNILLNSLLKDTDPTVRIKLLYCLSAAIRVCPTNFNEFINNDGFKIIVSACQDGNEQMIKRSLFLFDALMHEEDQSTVEQTNTKLMENAVYDMIIEILSKHELDLDLVEQCFKLLLSVANYSRETLEMWADMLKAQFEHILGVLANEDVAEVKSLISQLQELI
ncbi:hypothetical protein HDV06_002329 [Boothiomyces sp. JEL0866]|nr:hypothetical protein HDV06_002329 [Boothiomyces sp. JEL0866]